jgi:3-polyprenyl-4-hydroxybenzoate decarboxylase
LQWRAQDYEQAVQKDVETREHFLAEISESIQWMKEADLRLDNVHPETANIEEVNKQLQIAQVRVLFHHFIGFLLRLFLQELKRNIYLRQANIDQTVQQELQKYAKQQTPMDLKDQVQELRDIEAAVTSKAKEKERQIQKVQVCVLEYNSNLERLGQWLQMAERELAEPIGNLGESQMQHQV